MNGISSLSLIQSVQRLLGGIRPRAGLRWRGDWLRGLVAIGFIGAAAEAGAAILSGGPTPHAIGGHPQSPTVGDPMDPATRMFHLKEQFYSGAGVFPLTLNRAASFGGFAGLHAIEPLRSLDINRTLTIRGGKKYIDVRRPGGRVVRFELVAGAWKPVTTDIRDKLVEFPMIPSESVFEYRVFADGSVERFSPFFGLTSVTNRWGVSHKIVHGTSQRSIQSITHSLSGRKITFAHPASGDLVATDPAGGTFTFANQPIGTILRQEGVTYPDGNTLSYRYADGALFFFLNGITDQEGRNLLTVEYEDTAQNGWVVKAVHNGAGTGVNRYTFESVNESTRKVTDPLGTVRTYTYSQVQDVQRLTALDKPDPTSGVTVKAVTYDADANITSRTDFDGFKTNYTYDAFGREASRVEAVGTPQARTIKTEWHPTIGELPMKITEPLRETTFTYNGKGSLNTRTIKDLNSGVTRTWTYTHDANGQMLTEKTPLGGITTFTYAAAAGANGIKRGDLISIKNAVGHITTVDAYNAHGQPTQITDPNGAVTFRTYDAMRRLISENVAGLLTRYGYDKAGLLASVTLPNGSLTEYVYDSAQRLERVGGNQTTALYTLDGLGNRSFERTNYNPNVAGFPATASSRERTRTFGAHGELKSLKGGSDPADIVSFTHDGRLNAKQVDHPLSRRTVHSYDALGRRTQTEEKNRDTAASLGIWKFAYRPDDRLASVTDARNLVTGYTYNGFGDLEKTTSPDGGVSNNDIIDGVGNVTQRTDAKGQVTLFTYDLLGRITRVKPVNAPEYVWTWDTCTNGKGRLCAVANATDSIAYVYFPTGQLKQETRLILGKSYVTSYGYATPVPPATAVANEGDLISITYPSGRVVRWNTTFGEISNLASTIPAGTTRQFGATTYIPGTTRPRSLEYEHLFGQFVFDWGFDLDNRIKAYQNEFSAAGANNTIVYNAADRISSITQTVTPTVSALNTFGHDVVGRLAKHDSPSFSRAWTYDKNGNRVTQKVGPTTFTNVYPATSNRLSSVTGPVAKDYTYDANGSVTKINTTNLTYDGRGKLTGVGAITYKVNGVGQRVARTDAAGTTVFHYDKFNRLIATSTAAGVVIQEYMWLHDMLVAVFDAANKLYYVFNDHRNTPKTLVGMPEAKVVWRWGGEAFGSAAAETDPDGNGVHIDIPMRFAGQTFDTGTKLHYNTARDYDPSTGRYLQVDPIGLLGGMNPYVYAEGDPMKFSDPTGLSSCGNGGGNGGGAGGAHNLMDTIRDQLNAMSGLSQIGLVMAPALGMGTAANVAAGIAVGGTFAITSDLVAGRRPSAANTGASMATGGFIGATAPLVPGGLPVQTAYRFGVWTVSSAVTQLNTTGNVDWGVAFGTGYAGGFIGLGGGFSSALGLQPTTTAGKYLAAQPWALPGAAIVGGLKATADDDAAKCRRQSDAYEFYRR